MHSSPRPTVRPPSPPQPPPLPQPEPDSPQKVNMASSVCVCISIRKFSRRSQRNRKEWASSVGLCQRHKPQLCVLTLVQCPFHPHVTAVARKRPRSFCQKCRWQVTSNMRTPLTQRSRSGLTMPPSRHSVETYQETSSHATRQGPLGRSLLSWLSHCGLILA